MDVEKLKQEDIFMTVYPSKYRKPNQIQWADPSLKEIILKLGEFHIAQTFFV